jgi:hypothetical protein
LDLRGKVVRGDAMLTQRELSLQILDAGGDYLWVVKGNQPALQADIKEVFQPAPTAAGWGQARATFARLKPSTVGMVGWKNAP